MQEALMSLSNLTVKREGKTVLNQNEWTIHKGEQWVITGTSGSGKTSLALSIAGQLFFQGHIEHPFKREEILFVETQHHFRNLSNMDQFYYQQRFQASESEDSITVRDALSIQDRNKVDAEMEMLLNKLHLLSILDRPLIQLSNGENKRLQIAKALRLRPRLLLLDQPFTGLDKEGRSLLESILEQLSSEGLTILLISSVFEIPPYITHVISHNQGHIDYCGSVSQFQAPAHTKNQASAMAPFLKLLAQNKKADFVHAVRMKDVNIRYGEKHVLKDINWELKQGERWLVTGPNGSGKSTLLSLITGDHPQAFANDIWLFDRKKGSGESIWDIKKRIGLLSPEFHVYFDRSLSAYSVIGSGFFDTVGLFRPLSTAQEEQLHRCAQWLGVDKIIRRSLASLSLSEQRMLLLARALVKQPDLLVLDEPCQGLDWQQTDFFLQLVDDFCARLNTTLILVSHYSELVPACINRHLAIEEGRARVLEYKPAERV
jgi:molybdate transport system ATP-binding protein